MLKKLFLILLFSAFAFSGLVLALPNATGYVNDLEGIIENKAELEEKISNFEKETTIEIAVLTTPDFADTYIEDYAVQVFEKWGVGKEGEDNGVLIIVSKEQRQSRIEVGYGLEGVLTDGLTGRIQDSTMIPSFKDENYSEGISSGVDAIITVLGGGDVGFLEIGQESDDIEALGCLGIFFLSFLLMIPNPFVGAAIGALLGFWLGSMVFGFNGGMVGAFVGLILGFVFGLLAKMIPAPVRYGIARTMMSSGGRSSSGGFGGFGGGSSGGGGSSRSW